MTPEQTLRGALRARVRLIAEEADGRLLGPWSSGRMTHGWRRPPDLEPARTPESVDAR
jgi:hypothetical protein